MPSRLFYLKKKPKSMSKSQWKGAGYYYRRSKKKWQKYSRKLDAKRGRGVGGGIRRHTHDKKK